jgi:hypothetical protein
MGTSEKKFVGNRDIIVQSVRCVKRGDISLSNRDVLSKSD